MFYNLERKLFELPDPERYPYGTDNPDEANVVVCYEMTVSKVGNWVTSGNSIVADAFAQNIHLYLVRTSDWALIIENTVSDNLDYSETGNRKPDQIKDWNSKSIDSFSEVAEYLKTVFEE